MHEYSTILLTITMGGDIVALTVSEEKASIERKASTHNLVQTLRGRIPQFADQAVEPTVFERLTYKCIFLASERALGNAWVDSFIAIAAIERVTRSLRRP
ncbi:hypothetical protein CQ040_16740 [Microbacterium sp. MYb54]|nr:hypothetical protein CQ032_16280 [Microbacterium sp. MYb43]PQZ73258.1 hypothetical protein CQ031_17635 [Microbacterium sp. MYb40]PRB18722.1 hypothetical protein CQ040_16740 [Microbacterium sp. MYb54]PRB24385.1 hypothetical protein CQ037_17055 [Microbacterium sp. MYb50]PRB64433.1 hypothetical protein CQ027_20005 [Microbacterium sp. MYb32]PRB67249.1 hypothetical protein CQ021_08360 [Microbacterium sp. MYb24]